ncbi:unnamed protein product [Boreogadus saida]
MEGNYTMKFSGQIQQGTRVFLGLSEGYPNEGPPRNRKRLPFERSATTHLFPMARTGEYVTTARGGRHLNTSTTAGQSDDSKATSQCDAAHQPDVPRRGRARWQQHTAAQAHGVPPITAAGTNV